MKILLKQVTIADPLSPHNGLVKDILITNGAISTIADALVERADQVVDAAGLTVSPGWVIRTAARKH